MNKLFRFYSMFTPNNYLTILFPLHNFEFLGGQNCANLHRSSAGSWNDITFVQARDSHPPKIPTAFPKMDGIFHYFNESFVIDPLNDFERHFSWLSKTPLLLKIGQSP